MWVGWTRVVFAQHASIHCRSHFIHKFSIDYYRRFVFVCFVVVLFTVLFCSSQGLAWMQKVMVPRSNSFSLAFFLFLTHAWTSVKSAYFCFIYFLLNLHKIMLAHDVLGVFCECPTSSGCMSKKTSKITLQETKKRQLARPTAPSSTK
uniref:(northern house mosquito) hypothetical protein n=1 Tax=Culex pipiens TaxID=7175 RepID=A0A8D8N3H7_CULPI